MYTRSSLGTEEGKIVKVRGIIPKIVVVIVPLLLLESFDALSFPHATRFLITLANFTRTVSTVFGDILVLVLMGLVRMESFVRGELARSVPVSDSILTNTTKPPYPFRSYYQKGNAYVWSRQKT